MDNNDDFVRAKKVVNAKIAFWIHLTAYVVVNALLIAVNLTTSSAYLWFMWPLLGWGLGLFVHALVVFGLSKGARIKQRMIEREMRRSTLKKV